MEVIEVTEREVEIIEVIERGPQGLTGPTGPQGPAGAGGVTSVSGTAPIVSSGGTTPAISISAATTSAAGSMSSADKTKLDGIATGATANSSDATLLNRANHTGTQAANTISGLAASATTDTTNASNISSGTLGTARLSVGTTTGTVAAGDDSRITGAAQKSANLSDLSSASTARTNLGLGTAATAATGDFAAASHNHAASAITSGVLDNARINFAAPSAIGAQIPNTGLFTDLSVTSRLNLPSSGSSAKDIWVSSGQVRYQAGSLVTSARTLLSAEDNLSNLDNTATARTNLGVGSSSAVTFGSIQNTPIGSTTASTGAFTTLSATPAAGSALTLAGGTVTASAPLIDATQTWNNAAVTFTGLRLNATNTASASASLLADFQVGGTTQFSIRRDGATLGNYYRFTNLDAGLWVHSVGGQEVAFGISPNHWFTITSTRLRLSGDISLGRSGSLGQAVDCILVRDDAGILAQRNAANPQAYRIYNTFTDTNNYERGFMRWSSNVLQIGTEKAGTGSARALEFQTDGLTRLIISAGGSVVHGLSNGVIGWTSSTILRPVSGNGTLVLYNNAQTDFNRLQFGGTDATFPALKRSSTTLQVRLADDSAFAPLECAGLTLNGNLTASTRNIVTDTTTGTRIGTGTTQLLGFWNATPAAQPAAVADATDAATVITQLNALLSRLRTIGLIAT